MSREDTMICMDNSEWMRNGDYNRSRFEAQYQAIEYVLKKKTMNVENTVGLLSLAGGIGVGVQVLCSPTTERYRVGKAAQNAKIGGRADLLTGLKVAQLALKYRQNRQIQARIVVFVGSPLDKIDDQKLIKIAKQLKKSNIAVDVISMGEQALNEPLLNKFISEVEKRDSDVSSALVIVPPGAYVEDAIEHSAMVANVSTGGFDEEDDPMLAMALAESRAMADAQRLQADGLPQSNVPAASIPVSKTQNKNAEVMSTAATGEPGTVDGDDDDLDDEEAKIVAQAKLMSLMEDQKISARSEADAGASKALESAYVNNILKNAGVKMDPELQKQLDNLEKDVDDSMLDKMEEEIEEESSNKSAKKPKKDDKTSPKKR